MKRGKIVLGLRKASSAMTGVAVGIIVCVLFVVLVQKPEAGSKFIEWALWIFFMIIGWVLASLAAGTLWQHGTSKLLDLALKEPITPSDEDKEYDVCFWGVFFPYVTIAIAVTKL